MSDIATTISQSKRLLKAGVDQATADMTWVTVKSPCPEGKTDVLAAGRYTKFDDPPTMPAWSLSALFAILPRTILGSDCKDEDYVNELIVYPRRKGRTWTVEYSCNEDFFGYTHMSATNPSLIEACVLMIEMLLENGHKLNER